MSISSSPISSDERWRSSIVTSRSRRSRRVVSRAVLGLMAVVKAGGDHGDPDLVAERVVDDGAEDDVRVRVGGALDDLGRLVDLEQAEVVAAGDVEQDPGRALRPTPPAAATRWRSWPPRRPGSRRPAIADPHQRAAGVVHDRAHVGEVEVDQPGDGDQVGDALNALAQDVVGLAEGVEDRGAPLDDREQLLVGDHDQGVDVVAQALDALMGLAAHAGSPRTRTAASPRRR